jgi:AraC family transcriptional regulator of adaptative response / methylphosphotriester-DNA alkyltransferase methyltransferase
MDTIEATPEKLTRGEQLTAQYFNAIDNRMIDLANGRCVGVMTLKAVADLLFVHPRHLSNVIKEVTGHSTCYHFEHRLVTLAEQLLLNPVLTIKDVALALDYDPSNFTKFFKQYGGQTPSNFRKEHMVKY